MSNQITELEKEFELERLILFSDAVFAIAITLLIIEIKFPDVRKGFSNAELLTAFGPTIIGFLAFMLSFFFIGLLWSRHLNIFKYLRTYDNGVIFYNLLFLFFVVCFPFSASGLEHLRPNFFLPIFIYTINIGFVFLSQYLLCNYIFKSKKHLSKPGFEPEKKYILLKSKYLAFALCSVLSVVLILSFIFPEVKYIPIVGLYTIAIVLNVIRRRVRKYKPAAGEATLF
ncbi:MAG: TMEM175 family protein [Bacteroidota bacterium]|nr:TMEM175 family protein [Bacteroidota bacterium]